MSTTKTHDVRRRAMESRRDQLRRLAETIDAGIRLSRSHVAVPAADLPLLLDLLAEHEAKLRGDEIRATALEVIEMFRDRGAEPLRELPARTLAPEPAPERRTTRRRVRVPAIAKGGEHGEP